MYLSDAYDAAHARAAFIDRTTSRGRVIATGRDRATYLQGLLTNDIAALGPGSGCYAAYLTPQGRMISDLYVYELGDLMLITIPGEMKDAVLAKFDQFLFGEDVRLGDVTAAFAQIAVVGPSAVDVVASLLDSPDREALGALAEHGNLRATIQEQPAIVVRVADTGVPGYDLFVDAALAEGLRASLGARGVPGASAGDADVMRIEAGIPLFGRDMTADTIPLEAAIESRAISFTKGCYVGQEVIVRVLHRGHGRVARRLVGIVFEDAGALPPDGAVVASGGREVGVVTSAVFSPAIGKAIALGYVHRDFTASGTRVEAAGLAGSVADVPFARVGAESAP